MFYFCSVFKLWGENLEKQLNLGLIKGLKNSGFRCKKKMYNKNTSLTSFATIKLSIYRL